MSNPIRRAERLLDLASVGSIVGGAACYVRSYLAMQVLERGRLVPGAASHSAVQQFLYFRSLSEVGVGLVVLGVLIGVGSVLVNRRGALVPAVESDPDAPALDITPRAAEG